MPDKKQGLGGLGGLSGKMGQAEDIAGGFKHGGKSMSTAAESVEAQEKGDHAKAKALRGESGKQGGATAYHTASGVLESIPATSGITKAVKATPLGGMIKEGMEKGGEMVGKSPIGDVAYGALGTVNKGSGNTLAKSAKVVGKGASAGGGAAEGLMKGDYNQLGASLAQAKDSLKAAKEGYKDFKAKSGSAATAPQAGPPPAAPQSPGPSPAAPQSPGPSGGGGMPNMGSMMGGGGTGGPSSSGGMPDIGSMMGGGGASAPSGTGPSSGAGSVDISKIMGGATQLLDKTKGMGQGGGESGTGLSSVMNSTKSIAPQMDSIKAGQPPAGSPEPPKAESAKAITPEKPKLPGLGRKGES